MKQIELSGESLIIHQHGAEYIRSHEIEAGGKGGRKLEEDEFSWCVNFYNDKMSDIHINEGMRPGYVEPFVENRFTYNGEPDSSDSSELMQLENKHKATDGMGEADTTMAEGLAEPEKGEI